MSLSGAAVFLGILGAARADEAGPSRGLLAGRIVSSETLTPLDGATIVVTDTRAAALVVTGTTDRTGSFRYGLPAGRYDVLAVFGDARWLRRGVVVEVGRTTAIAGVLAVDGELVTIHEHAPAPQTPAKVVSSTVKNVPPYSDEAIQSNAWAVCWVLLAVDELGSVTGFWFLHRPGHGLDSIAEKEIWSLRFEPARDGTGKAVPSTVLWKLEWPAFHWAKQHELYGAGGQGALIPPLEEDAHRARAGGTFVLPGEHKPPCRGAAPLSLDLHEPIYRDCSPPDLGAVNTGAMIPRP